MTQAVLTQIDCPTLSLFKQGKVRHVYDLGSELLFVASDRVSSFDFILPNGIPNKGNVLTSVSVYWFKRLQSIMPTHFITDQFDDFPDVCRPYREQLEGRSMLVKKTELIEIECVVRGYVVGGGWKEYQQKGSICGQRLPEGLREAGKLPEPLFTPAYKAQAGGHDENISIEKMRDLVGSDVTDVLIEKSKLIYQMGHDHMAERGVILADTKFEFGLLDGEVVLIDEVMTPDSSRYWPMETYQEGMSPPSFDKQIIRNHLEATWDKQPPVPELPQSIIDKASQRYAEVQELILS